jgi:hypothetical protein
LSLLRLYSFSTIIKQAKIDGVPILSFVCTWSLPAVLCLAAAAALPLGSPAPAEGPVAALFPPWWRAADVFAAAGSAGLIVRPGPVSFVVIVAPEAGRIAERLRAAGAILVIDPVFVGGCSPVAASTRV